MTNMTAVLVKRIQDSATMITSSPRPGRGLALAPDEEEQKEKLENLKEILENQKSEKEKQKDQIKKYLEKQNIIEEKKQEKRKNITKSIKGHIL